jgi:hypothetical protein
VNGFDTEKERQRLTAHYAGVSEGELLAMAEDWNSLTAVAQDVLRTELGRRQLEAPIAEPIKELGGDSGHAPPPLVTIRRFLYLSEAEIAKSILNSAGIECYLADDNIVRIDWFLSNAVGGVKLRVKEEDRDRGAELLNSEPLESFQVGGVGEYKLSKCPICASSDISFRDINMWRCFSCGNEWVESEDQPH